LERSLAENRTRPSVIFIGDEDTGAAATDRRGGIPSDGTHS
jgi:hypothetical protein